MKPQKITGRHKPLNSSVMLENTEDCQCPVRSFKIYYEHLNPDNGYLRQYPNLKPKNHDSPIWYTKAHLGKTPLGNFLADLCKRIGTSKHYTNHCIQVSSTSVVTCTGKYSKVMDLSGHKSIQSFTVYQRIQLKKKMEMAQDLKNAPNKTNDQLEEEQAKKKKKMSPRNHKMFQSNL